MTDPERDLSLERWLRQTPVEGAGSESSACLDAETLAAFAEGLLNRSERSTAESHASGCARCQAMLAVMVQTMPGPPPRSESPLRKWLMMLSPALAAGAAVAVWIAVDQGPGSTPAERFDRDRRSTGTVAESARLTDASPPAATEKDTAAAPGASSDREAVTKERAAPALQATLDTREERVGTDKKALGVPLEQATSVIERIDEAAVKRTVGALSPSPPAPGPPAAAVESAQAAARERSALNTALPPAPSQAGQNQPTGQNQQDSQSQGRVASRQRADAPAEPLAAPARPAAAAADNAAKRAAADGFADTGRGFGFRANAGQFEVASPDGSARWRIVEGRTVQRSLDAGTTWTNHYTAEDGVMLTAGAAPTSTVCWLVGRGGAIVLTTDGRAWQRVKFSEPLDLTAVTSTDARTATVTLANGRRFVTTDGGRSWTPR
jgi:hypothetical protein